MTIFNQQNGRFYARDRLSVKMNVDKHLLFVWLFVSSIKTGTRPIKRLDELHVSSAVQDVPRKVDHPDA